jgi:iron(III) transport system substrate-binding protein
VQNNAPENEAAYREKLLQEVWSPHLKDLVPAAAPAHRGWAGITLDVWTAAYNTNLVKKEDLPKSYRELADPRWKGRLGIEVDNHAWFGTLMGELGEEQGLRLFNQIVATNGISARKGHSALANLAASGDVPLALTVYSWIPEQLKKKGAPIENWIIQPLLAQPSTIGIPRRAPNPASALLFYDYVLGRGAEGAGRRQLRARKPRLSEPLQQRADETARSRPRPRHAGQVAQDVRRDRREAGPLTRGDSSGGGRPRHGRARGDGRPEGWSAIADRGPRGLSRTVAP